MPARKPVTGDAALNLATLSHLFIDETKAREFLEAKRWPNGPVCPHCACTDIYKLTAKAESKRPVRPGVYKCKACRKQFTVRIGTVFEESKVPLSKWLMAIHLMTSSKKGVSSHQIARECGITQKSAWFLNHRIREAMKEQPLAAMLEGAVEVDETYVGGKPRYKGQSKRGRGTAKTPVMFLVQRDGSARCFPLENVDGKTLQDEIAVNVAQTAIVVTDELPAYNGVALTHGAHETVSHSAKEYVHELANGFKVHTNTAESLFALLKRGHYGIFHQLSKRHLHRYCSEFAFRWKHRRTTDGERMVAAIGGIAGRG